MSARKKTLADAGELAFIKRIRDLMPSDGGDIIRSVGDDCLVVKSPGKGTLLMTTDTFVEHVHFSREYMTYRQTGARCMAASVSDIAAMAGFPRYTLVSLSLPQTMAFDDAVGLFTGLARTADQYECPIAGGETTSTPGPATVTVTVIGTAPSGSAVMRSGAKPGDHIYVSGSIGDAMGGLLAFQRGTDGFESLKEKFVAPEARVVLARSLTEIYTITSMIDLSDGIGSDLMHLCEESGCGAELDETALPISAGLHEICRIQGLPVTEFALGAGEDFELLFTSSDPSLSASFRFLGLPVTRIGQIIGERGTIVLKQSGGGLKPFTVKGYEHFSR